MRIRKELHPEEGKKNEKVDLPPVCFALTPKEKKTFFKSLCDVKVPIGDEDIPTPHDVNKGDGLRHAPHEEIEDDVNHLDGLRLSKNDHSPITCSHARKLQHENSLFAPLNTNISGNLILPKCSIFVFPWFIPEDIITAPRRMGYIEDNKGYVERESAHVLPAAVYTNKKIYLTMADSTKWTKEISEHIADEQVAQAIVEASQAMVEVSQPTVEA
uniref:Uncharacterized protein n=1 Tax=Oryza punctata TaxID=4537 RepID=A0A0E0KN95_ORYPU